MNEQMKIRFTWEGVRYETDTSFSKSGIVQLPDGRLLQVRGGWRETWPPQPAGLTVIDVPKALAAS